ncbi:ankyrin repeat-containing protein BDA1-like [Macadamia integrifolia]|uniref:ankyrin repeat-containing protein BDA1-like n=1 Tax=Macadamia integrifolia TaxID=60698 RepID=UPI001C4F2325|nr:ankyrin repeat-containing protein BDA1-like [Macadamia integrifolia]
MDQNLSAQMEAVPNRNREESHELLGRAQITLMEAAQNGNIKMLYELLGRDSSLLDKADQQFKDNPLHIAVAAAATATTADAKKKNKLFAAEIAVLKPLLARKLNQDGWSPLHIAAEKGHVETVKMLLKVDKELCFIKGQEGMVPLHCAAKSGNPHSEDVMKELLSACPKCITALTTRNETALHIAAKSGNSKNFEALLKWIKKKCGYNILGWKDHEGNTILHLATSERKPKNLEIVKLLLCKNGYFVRKAAKMNTKNTKGDTALDVLTGKHCNGTRANGSRTEPVQEDGMLDILAEKAQGDEDEKEVQKKIQKILKKAGAKRAEDICCTNKRALDSGIKWLLKIPNFLSFKVDKDTPSDIRNALLVIFILIVTVTYTTGINPPGGIWQDENPNDNGGFKKHTAGTSIWFDHNPDSFQVLMYCNYAGFLASVVLVFNLTEGYPLRGPILLALLFMLVTYALSFRLLFLDTGALAILTHGMILTVPLPVALLLLAATANWICDIKE